MVTMMSFAIAIYGQCCRRHVVGQEIVSNSSIVRSF